ncbi:MAG: hypothetical protein JRN52_10800 [Nitrososphaerota archaeon]|nr:hypothetical protein [Nitrososphaerota archaeon]
MSLEDALTINGLLSTGPDPGLGDKLKLFGQFVGDWDILEDRFFKPDGTEEVQSGELHWGWILGGKAVQDVWMYHDKETNRAVPAGTTVRFYDSETDAWHSVWITPEGNAVITFVGHQVENEIVLEGKDQEDTLLKWVFSDIKSDSFTWRGEESKDDGKTWVLTERMQIHRRPSQNRK